jgi:hypothetical protein
MVILCCIYTIDTLHHHDLVRVGQRWQTAASMHLSEQQPGGDYRQSNASPKTADTTFWTTSLIEEHNTVDLWNA